MFFAETVESQNLFVELGEDGFELLIDVDTTSEVVGVLIVGQRLGCGVLSFTEVLCRGSGDSMERDGNVFAVSDLLEVHVGDLLVAGDGGVVCHNVAW